MASAQDGSMGKGKDGKPDMGMNGTATTKQNTGNPDAGATGAKDTPGEPKGMGDTSNAIAKQGDPSTKGQQSNGKGGPNDKNAAQGSGKSGPGEMTETARGNEKGNEKGNAGDKSDEVDPKNADLRDVAKLNQQLAEGDKSQWEKAVQKLEDVAKQTDDAEARELAKKMLDDIRKGQTQKEQLGEVKADNRRGPNDPPEQNPSESKGDGGDPKSGGSVKGSSQQGGGVTKEQGKQPADPDVKGLVANQGSQHRRDTMTQTKSTNPQVSPDTTLQLDQFDASKFKDRVTRALEAAKPGTEPPTPTTAKEKLPDPRNPNVGAVGSSREVVPNGTTTEPVDPNRASPPPGYRRAAAEFTRQANQPEKKDPK